MIKNQLKNLKYRFFLILINVSIFILPLTLSIRLNAQAIDTSKAFNPILNDIIDYIPPLAVLIESAYENSPLIKSREADLNFKNTVIKSTQKLWIKNIGLESYFNYGTADYYSINTLSTSQSLVSTQQTTSRYNIGAYLRLPLYDILDRSNLIKAEKYRYEQSYWEKEEQKLTIKKLVIQQYNELILKQKLFKIANEAYLDAKLQANMAEKEFSQGELPLTDYARFRDIRAKSIMQYETSKYEFVLAYMLLQETTGLVFENLKFIE
jgi:outer membrane protein TolC